MKRVPKWMLWGLLILFTLGAVVWTIANAIGSSRIDATVESLQAGGYLALVEEPKIAEKDNAEPHFLAAFGYLNRPASPHAEDALALIRKGRLTGPCRYSRNYDAGFEMRFDEFAPTNRAMDILKERVEKNPADAREFLLDMRALAEAFDEPVLICQVIRIMDWEMILETMDKVATAKDTTAWLEILPAPSHFDGMISKALRGELRSTVPLLQDPDWFHRLIDPDHSEPPVLWLLNPRIRLDGAEYLRRIARWIDLARHPVAKIRAEMEANDGVPTSRVWHPVHALLMPGMSSLLTRQAKMQSRLAVMRAGLGSGESLDPWTGGTLSSDETRIWSASGAEWKKRP